MNAGKAFRKIFFNWLDNGLSVDIPANVTGFSFNLVELSPDGRFGVELIGAPGFSIEDEDWACDDVFSICPSVLEIPFSFSGQSWERCLDKMKTLASEYIYSNSNGANVLKAASGVGIGFVDGDLHIINV